MLRGLALLLVFQSLGEALARLSGVPVPGPVIGLVLLLMVLVGREHAARPRWRSLEQAADGLLAHLSIFFVPAAVGVMLHWEPLARAGLAWVLSIVLSTVATIAVTAWWLARRLPPEPDGATGTEAVHTSQAGTDTRDG